MAERSRGVRAAVVVLVGVAVLSAVGWPGEAVTVTAGPVAGPWRPPGRGTPSIDVLGDVPSGAELFDDVAVSVGRRGVAAVRVGGGGRWTYQRLWGDDLVDWVRVDDRRGAAVWRDGRVTLVDVPTGRVVWRADLPAGPFAAAGRTLDGEWRSMWTLSVARPGMLVILHDGRLDVLDARTGATRWTRPAASCGPVDEARALGDVVLTARRCAGYAGAALGAEDGEPRWTFADAGPYDARDLGAGRAVTVEDGGLVVRRTADWQVVWRLPRAGLRPNPSAGSLGVTADLVIADTAAGIAAYRVADGGLAWRRPLERPAGTSQDVLTDGRVVYVAADERTVLALDARTGAVIDRRGFDDRIDLRSMRSDLAVVTVGAGRDQVLA
ncbi:outer membrane protein assembly factor BamB family protein [Nonomuraea sp. NPDC001699]